MRKFLFFLFIFSVFLKADIILDGYIHVGDNDDFDDYIPKEPITFNAEHTYNYYLNNPTNFYISKDINITGVELVNAVGIESDDRVKVFIDGERVGKGELGSNVIEFNLSLDAGFHTIAVKGVCYDSDGEKTNCNKDGVVDIDDFYFEKYKLLTSDTDDNIKNFTQRHHIGDDEDNYDDWYDDLDDDDNKPFWYPDDNEGKDISYDFNVSCDVSSIDFYVYRIRDIDYEDTDDFQLYINDSYVGHAYINTNDDGVYDLHFIYTNDVAGPFTATVKIISGRHGSDYDDFSWDDLIVVPHCENNTDNQTNSVFNAVDYIQSNCNAVEDWDNNITTKLVNKEFNLSILAKDPDSDSALEANITKVTLYYYNSSSDGKCSGDIVSTKVICENCGQTDTNGCMSLDNDNLNIDRAVKCVEVNIQGYALSNTSTDSNESNSTDNFAVRPEKFVITDIPDSIKAGNEFNITVQAVDVKGNPVKDYNESIYINGQSVDLEYNETKTNCETGTLEKISGGEFKDGEANITLKYSEAGDVNLTLREVNASEFASVDSDDTNETQRLIQPVSSNVKVGIDHFKISATLDNYDKEGNFTYYDADMNLASVLDINITAQNKDNETVKNYNSECYAKDVDINISNLFTYNNKNLGVSTVKYYFTDVNGDKSDIATADMNTAINIAYSEGNFTTEDNGSTHLSVYMNFDRNDSYGANPMIVKTDEINVSDSDVLSEEKNISGSAIYLYGNILLDDVIANSNEFNKTYSFVIYDENSSDTIKPAGKEMLINWYENTIHEAKDGNVSDSEIVISSDYNSSDKIDGVDVSVKDISAGKITFDIKRTDSNVDFAVVHLLSPNLKWLWYSKYSNRYDISESSTCLNHFCFSITWQNINSYGEVGSGNFKGTEANVTESNTTKRGVKIFR